MKTAILVAALALIGAAPAFACDFHATHTTAAEAATVVACSDNNCAATEASPAQQPATPAAQPASQAAAADDNTHDQR